MKINVLFAPGAMSPAFTYAAYEPSLATFSAVKVAGFSMA